MSVREVLIPAVTAAIGFLFGSLLRKTPPKRKRAPVTPDPKETWLISSVLARIVGGTFSEPDVLALLILLRRHAEPRSAVLEFADFVAHRTRDRGRTRQYLDQIQKAFHGMPPPKPVTLPVYSVEELELSINRILGRLGLAPIDDETANRLLVCIICMLQTAEAETTLRSAHRSFGVGISNDKIVLSGHSTVPAGHVFAFDMLIAKNNGYDASLNLLGVPPIEVPITYQGIVEAHSVNGIFRIEQRTARIPDPPPDSG